MRLARFPCANFSSSILASKNHTGRLIQAAADTLFGTPESGAEYSGAKIGFRDEAQCFVIGILWGAFDSA
jgi:hypothetical protein